MKGNSAAGAATLGLFCGFSSMLIYVRLCMKV